MNRSDYDRGDFTGNKSYGRATLWMKELNLLK